MHQLTLAVPGLAPSPAMEKRLEVGNHAAGMDSHDQNTGALSLTVVPSTLGLDWMHEKSGFPSDLP
ncbi:hypothetical protein AGRA3207_007491 [Actinomadura graeca]|uniref:DUF397 domain-containing protein n=1 Tax=Actinomadura graeca TaxID=2750812 RepID=A0ABX8R4D9_9ACTN|nr:hypothetical protein [Actinomadura graeca]QXJ25922.1 hypothetical protein AGRA3207_007491 [Actinomadura graeca]